MRCSCTPSRDRIEEETSEKIRNTVAGKVKVKEMPFCELANRLGFDGATEAVDKARNSR